MQLAISLHSSSVQSQKLLATGMVQNMVFFYELLELLGFKPFFLVFEDLGDTLDINGKKYRSGSYKQVVAEQRKVDIVFEIGITVLSEHRKLLRSECGSKIVVVKYGNSMIIDLECIILGQRDLGQLNVTGADQVWISPHHERNLHYLQSLHNCEALVCPYLWEPTYLSPGEFGGQTETRPSIFVMEPNVNVVKSSMLPLCIINDLWREDPEKFERAMIVNGTKLQQKPYFVKNIVYNLPALHAGANKVFFTPRATFDEVFSTKAILLGYHWENALNYLYCEAVYKGIPLVHNSDFFREVGYYYQASNVEMGVDAIKQAIEGFSEPESIDEGREFLYQYSIHNSKVQKAYLKLIDNVLS